MDRSLDYKGTFNTATANFALWNMSFSLVYGVVVPKYAHTDKRKCDKPQ